jgi:hypothetical protein
VDSKKYARIIRNPRHVHGVFNYCDRWCERCPLTLRCSVFAVGEQLDKHHGPHDRTQEDLWPRLETARDLARQLLVQHADHPGVGLDKDPLFKSHERAVDTHRLGVAVKRYSEFTHKFVKAHEAALSARPPAPKVHAVSAAEAFDVIGYYHLLVMVKLSRALKWDELDEEMAQDPEMAGMPRDQDGTAKLVLILLERSILAWAVLSLHEAEHREAALSAMLTLHRLRAGVEKEFPNAPTFVRPGFDTLAFPNKKK